MNLLRRRRETHFPEPRLLDTLTPGVPFKMIGTAHWKGRRLQDPDLQTVIEAMVRDAIVQRAKDVAIKWYADDISGAQDAINTDLRLIPLPDTRYYSSLMAAVTLGLSDQADADARKYRHSLAQVKRLCFLKQQIYRDPAMLLLDYLDKNPGSVTEPPDLAHFQKLALQVRNGERWWCRIIEALDKLSSKVPDEDGNLFAMNLLVGVLKQEVPDLFKQYQGEEAAASSVPKLIDLDGPLIR